MTEHYKNHSLENIVEEIDGVVYVEEWRSISGYEGLYEVSNFGRIKSLAKSWVGGNTNIIKRKEKIIKTHVEQEYVRVSLCKKGKYKGFQVHRLVGFAFINNPENKPHINHLFGIKTDNRWLKIEWSTRSENELHSYRVLGKKPSNTWVKNFDRSRKVLCLNNNQVYGSIMEAANKLELHRRCINRVCSGERKHHKGFNFKYL